MLSFRRSLDLTILLLALLGVAGCTHGGATTPETAPTFVGERDTDLAAGTYTVVAAQLVPERPGVQGVASIPASWNMLIDVGGRLYPLSLCATADSDAGFSSCPSREVDVVDGRGEPQQLISDGHGVFTLMIAESPDPRDLIAG